MNINNTIQNELKELDSMLAGIPVKNVFTVPEGYFEASLYDILYAVRQESPLSSTQNQVPEGYFEHLAGSIMQKIKNELPVEEESTLLSSVRGINVFRVPQGYFEELAGATLDRAATEITTELLSAAKKNNVYQVPAGYFDELAGQVIQRIPKPAKLFAMSRPASIFKYAAAAVVTGIIGLSAISIFNHKNTGDALAPTGNVMAEANIILKTGSFDKVLSTVSDDDIVNYLEKSGEDVNAALVAVVAAEDKNLPEQADYLTDDKTLDNLLSGLNIDQTGTN